MSEGRVNRTGNHFGVDVSELIDAITERHYFCRTDESTTDGQQNIDINDQISGYSQVERIEEEDHIFAPELR